MWDKIQIFGFRALWNPEIIIITLLLILLYYLFTGPLKHKAGLSEGPTKGQKISMYSAIILFYITKGSPVYLLSHIILMAHMAQMAVFYLLVPILVIRGIPLEWWKKVFTTPIVGHFFKLFTRPILALVSFNVMFSLYHVPFVLDFTKTSNLIHWPVTLLLFILAFCMWWPIFTPIKEQMVVKPLFKILYIYGAGMLLTPACALIIFADTPLYATYSEPDAFMTALALCVPPGILDGMNFGGPQVFMNIPLVYDQQAAGIIMKVAQEFIYGAIIARIFYGWFRSERKRGIDPLPQDLQTATPSVVERG
ncbi:cytochrome c oxidase assembly factor CtaG [Alkalibacillus haloalkaliphilus]|uniref:Cytochrome c oxidase assembly factor CtaG n=1 Tax=Alkalibacillus haloalkaliphilus TaxID=94136 RepID=A0A511W107_9BACI|nr:cytochrome c oxidase assembly factor CtaG [Alkalibacillus haloalkaliphilus]GEN44780.1 cytochrome c oxidase assembly factor CtaG [Alkalibacillus haloalkaliphilus]